MISARNAVLKVSSTETKTMVFLGKNYVKTKIVIDNSVLQ